uniref:J domain-containing protein n=1 Tax=viral metagenome TaxID=1070528 RepID=A0A6C0F4I3_9ZZZZ
MNNEMARLALDIDKHVVITPELLKKQYRIKALMYHPDKNKSQDANEQFRQIHEAYQFLSHNNKPPENQTYVDLLKEFLNNNSPIVHIIVNKLTQLCEEKAVKFIETIDKQILIDIYKLLVSNKDVLHIPDILIDEMKRILIAKTSSDERIVLNPSLEDLMRDNLYKLVVNEQTYLIPLWHHELVYDNSGSDLYVKCNPILPDHVKIDEMNNLIVSLKYNICDLLIMDAVNVLIGGREFSFQPKELKIMNRQQIAFVGVGISRIKPKNVYDVSTRGDVVLDISFVT